VRPVDLIARTSICSSLQKHCYVAKTRGARAVWQCPSRSFLHARACACACEALLVLGLTMHRDHALRPCWCTPCLHRQPRTPGRAPQRDHQRRVSRRQTICCINDLWGMLRFLARPRNRSGVVLIRTYTCPCRVHVRLLLRLAGTRITRHTMATCT
jgi:hypothetical protein